MLREYGTALPAMLKEGVAVHVITSEPGSRDTIWRRLEARETPRTGIVLHSDPAQQISAAFSGSDIFVIAPQQASQFGGDYEDYMMVQPAQILIDATGNVVQWWSWKAMVAPELAKAMTKVPNPNGGEDVLLVTVRPAASDVLPAIAEQRPWKLEHVVSSASKLAKLPSWLAHIVVGCHRFVERWRSKW